MNYFNQLITALENRQETDAMLIVKENGNEFNKYQEHNGNTILTYAIKNKLPLFSNAMLRDQVLINMPDGYGNYPLHLSINRGYEDLAIQLLKFKANSTVQNNSQMYPFFLALNKGMFNLIDQMLEDPNVINLTNIDGNNALMVCINKFVETKDKQYIDLAKKLIEKGIDLHYSNRAQDTPNYKENALTLAIKSDVIPVAKEIIKIGKGLNIEDKDYKRPITLCIEKGLENLGISLLEHNIELGYTINGDTALTYSIKQGMYAIADAIVTKRQLIDHADNDGNRPIGLAIERGLVKLTNKLIDIKYANDHVAYIANLEDFPLTLAIKYDQFIIAQDLINKCKGLAINVYDKQEKSPFCLALIKGYDDLCHLMIKNGLDLNKHSNEVETHFTMAIKAARPEVVKALVNKGVDYKANKRGESPENICRALQMTSILNIINKNAYSSPVNNPPIVANKEHFNKKNQPKQESPFISDKEKQSAELHRKIKSML